MMKIKNIKFSAVAFFTLLLTVLCFQSALGANDVTVNSDVSIVLPSNSQVYIITADSTSQSFTVNNSNIQVILEASSTFSFTSAARSTFSFSGGPNDCSASYSCETSVSRVSVSCPSNTTGSGTVTIAPTGTCAAAETSTGNSSAAPISSGSSSPGGGSSDSDSDSDTDADEDAEAEAAAEAEGCGLTEQKAYKYSGSTAVYYITKDCTKRAFTNSNIFLTYFDSWDDVEVATKTKLDAISNDSLGFMPWGPNYDPKYGALVKTVSDPKVYLLLGVQKYWITSETVFNTLYNGRWDWIEDIDERLLNKYGVGSEINYIDRHPNYTIIKYADSTEVYRLEPKPFVPSTPLEANQQVKRHVADEKAFESLKFRWDRIVEISGEETYEDGEVLTGPGQVMGEKVYSFTSFLSTGSAGEEVKQLQLKLKEFGHFPADLDATGYFGPATEKAVKDFQAANGISAAGFVGPATRTALNAS